MKWGSCRPGMRLPSQTPLRTPALRTCPMCWMEAGLAHSGRFCHAHCLPAQFVPSGQGHHPQTLSRPESDLRAPTRRSRVWGGFSSAPQMGYRQLLMGRAGGYPLLYRNITFKHATDGLKPPTPNQTSERRCHPVSRCQPRVPSAAVRAGSLDPYPKATQHHHPALKTLAAREKP